MNRLTDAEIKELVDHICETWQPEIQEQVKQDQEMRDWEMWDLEFDVFQRYSNVGSTSPPFEIALRRVVFDEWARVTPNPFAVAYLYGQKQSFDFGGLRTATSVADAISKMEAIRRGSRVGAEKSTMSRMHEAKQMHAEVVKAARQRGWPRKVPGLISNLAKKFGRSDQNIRDILKRNLQIKGADLE